MLLCPITDLNKSPLAQQMADFQQQVQQITTPLREAMRSAEAVDVAEAEQQLAFALYELGRVAAQEMLQALDPGTDKVEVDGQVMQRVLYKPHLYQTRFGPVRVQRGLYRPRGRNTATLCPLEIKAGIMEGFWTPGAARLALLLGGQLPLRAAQQIATEAGLVMTTSSLGRLLPALSQRWEESRQSNEAQLREAMEIPESAVTVCVSVDGVLAPMREKSAKRQAQRDQPGKHGSGPGGYREVGCGTISFHDAQGERLSTSYRARMPEAKRSALGQTLKLDMVHLVTQQPRLRRVYLADGADINWQIAATIEDACQSAWYAEAPIPAVHIVDFYHACEHLKRGCDAAWGASTVRGKAEFVKLRTILREADNGIEKVINVLRYQLGRSKKGTVARTQIEKELTYFRNQRERMRYAHYLRQHLPIASGVVEAACKTLVTQRLKGSGMAWTTSGGQSVLNVRCWLRSECFDAAWQILSKTYQRSCQPVVPDTKSCLRLVA